jgi:hypothetical protein
MNTNVCIDDFELLKVIGRGTVGRVLLARRKLDRKVKLKFLDCSLLFLFFIIYSSILPIFHSAILVICSSH